MSLISFERQVAKSESQHLGQEKRRSTNCLIGRPEKHWPFSELVSLTGSTFVQFVIHVSTTVQEKPTR